MDPFFLTLEELILIHRDQVERYGGSHGLLDIGLLQSAIAVPTATFGGDFLHRDLAEMAAAYLFHIVSNHPFADGNKRVGAVAAAVFLEINDVRFNATEEEYEELVLAVAAGKADKSVCIEFFRRNTKP